MTSDFDEKPVLSKRELEVLNVVADGLSNQEVAAKLVISANTVRVHLRNIFKKLDVQSRTEAVKRATQLGLIEPHQVETAENALSTPLTPTNTPPPTPENRAPIFNTPQVTPPTMPQQIYLGAAFLVGLLVLLTPFIAPFLRPIAMNNNAIVDQASGNANFDIPISGSENWRFESTMPVGRSRFALATVDDRVFVIGGVRSSGATGLVEAFDLETRNWQEVAGKPTLTANINATVINGEIFVPGGCEATGLNGTPTDQLEIFDPAANQWRSGAPLPEPLCGYASVVFQDELYLIGGWNGETYVDTVYVYNPTRDSWRVLPDPYPLAAGFAAATSTADHLWVIGGYDGEQEYAEVYAWQSETDTWAAQPSLTEARGGATAIVSGETLFVLGGGFVNPLSSNERLSLNTNQNEAPGWETIETPYTDQWRNFGATTTNGKILAFGGWNGTHLDSVISYQTEFQIFIPLSP